MSRGPKPKPTALRLLDGGRSTTVSTEPVFTAPAEMPEPPFYLNTEAADEWRRVVPDLYTTGVYTTVDQTMLAAYCMAYSRWVRAEMDLDRMAAVDPTTHGVMMKTTNGNAIQNPLVGVASTARRDMQRLAAEFGLTPSSRTQLTVDPNASRDATAQKWRL